MLNAAAPIHWFAFKVFYNKVFEIQSELNRLHVESYIPLQTVEVVRRGITRTVRRPAVASLLFFRSTEQQAKELQQLFRERTMLYIHRDTRLPAIIPEQEMRIFILVTSTEDNKLEYFNEEHAYCTGDRVRVTGGIFKGAEGYIRRIRGDRRLVVAIEGIVAVATTYIPSCFLEKIEHE